MYEGPVQDLIDELGRLPGIGPKSAQRLAFHILKIETVDAERLARAITEVKARVHFCRVCWNVAEGDLCRICKDSRRDPSLVCVVEEPRDLVAIERTQEFRGRYHVLGGAISPIEGIGPDDLRIRELLSRLEPDSIREVILATNPNIEGEATAMYLAAGYSARANRSASSTARSFSGPRGPIRLMRREAGTVRTLSALATQARGTPSAGSSGTSTAMPRLLVVSGTRVTDVRTA